MYISTEDYFREIQESRKEFNSHILKIKKVAYEKLEKIKNERIELFDNKNAKFYWDEGCKRRITYIINCLDNIFNIITIRCDTVEGDFKSDTENLPILEVNYQLFILNISGLFDDIAWIINFRENLELKKGYVVLSDNNKTMSETLNNKYINLYSFLPELNGWNNQYKKQMRDPICHRIPIKISRVFNSENNKTFGTKQYTEPQKIMDLFIYYNSYLKLSVYSEKLEEKCFHFSFQLINDILTVVKVLGLFIADLNGTKYELCPNIDFGNEFTVEFPYF